MNHKAFIPFLTLIIACNMSDVENTIKTEPPVAKKEPKELTIHGDTRIDNYYWLNDREDKEVIQYLEDENAYTKSMLAHTDSFQKELFQEMKSRIKETDLSVPYKDNGYYYYSRYEEGKEYPIYCRKKGKQENAEEIMLEVNDMAKGHDYYQVGGRSVSPDNSMLAYGVDTLSRRIYTVHFKNLETGIMLTDEIPNTTGTLVWANDNKTVFYTVKDESLRPYKIYRHVLGTPVSDDVEVYHEDDPTFTTYIFRTRSDKYLIIGSSATLSNEYRLLSADDPMGEFQVFYPRKRDLEYYISHFNNDFYILTNHEAKNFRLMKTNQDNTDINNWEEVIEHRDHVYLENFETFKDFLVLEEREGGLTKLRIIKHDKSEEHYIDFGEPTYTAYTHTNMEFDTDTFRFGYTSMTTPNSVYDYNMNTREKVLLKQQEVLGRFNPSDYQAERIDVKVRDGVDVPMSMVYKKGLKKDGNAPLLLYAYGSYGANMDAYFSSVRLSLLDRGFVYVIAHIRGGQELGRDWYEDGKLLKKKNTFYDFIDCAEFLVENKYTNTEKLFAMGGSAGGLLMGAVINMRPDLFKGAIAAVPFVDVVTTMLDESIPLTTGEYDEWGNPNDKEYYDYILSYSPYDNVESKDYPNLLVTTGLHDSQVQYWEPAKWVAKLRDMKTDNNLLLLHTNMSTGHGGASGRFEYLKEIAMEYAFLLELANVDDI